MEGFLVRFQGNMNPYWVAPALLFSSITFYCIIFYKQDLSAYAFAVEEIPKLTRTAIVFMLLSLGASVVIATAQIDLTSVGVATVSGVLFALTQQLGYSLAVNYLIGLILCFSFAVASGALVAFCLEKLKAPLLILTWALGSIYVVSAPILSRTLSDPTYGDVSGVRLRSMPADYWSMSGVGIYSAAIVVTASILIPLMTTLSVRARAIGSSELSANYAGVPIVQTYYKSFIYNAILASLAGIFQTLVLGIGSTQNLKGQELMPIAIAILSGTFLGGGYLGLLAVVAGSYFWASLQLIGPMLPTYFPVLSEFQGDLDRILFFSIFIAISVVCGRYLNPPLPKVYASQQT